MGNLNVSYALDETDASVHRGESAHPACRVQGVLDSIVKFQDFSMEIHSSVRGANFWYPFSPGFPLSPFHPSEKVNR